jgi:hypothetical protein
MLRLLYPFLYFLLIKYNVKYKKRRAGGKLYRFGLLLS